MPLCRHAYQTNILVSWSAAGWPSPYQGVVVGSVHTDRSQECSACRCPCSQYAARHWGKKKSQQAGYWKVIAWGCFNVKNQGRSQEKRTSDSSANQNHTRLLANSEQQSNTSEGVWLLVLIGLFTCTCHSRSCSRHRGWSHRCSGWCQPRSCHPLRCWAWCPWMLRPGPLEQTTLPLLVGSTWREEGRPGV